MIQAKIVKGDRVIAHSIANTKPEAEADLLYQLMERIHHIRAILRQESHLMSKTNLRRLKQELKQLEEQN